MFEDILGNDNIKKFLKNYLTSENHPHALLFVGNPGLGKGLLAKEFAKALLCNSINGRDDCQSCRQFQAGVHPDFVEIGLLEDKKFLSIEQMRELIAGSAFAPVLGKRKVILINDVDLLKLEGANAILKLLEEPPESWTIILIATHEDRLLPTILSRVVTLRFAPLRVEEIEQAFLRRIDDVEQARVYARIADGSIGMAIKLYEKDALELRNGAMNLLSNLPTRYPLNLACNTFFKLENGRKFERDEAILWLRLWQLLLRDVLLIKFGLGDLANIDLQFELNKFAANVTREGLEKALLEVERANRDLFASVSVKQVFEQLVMETNMHLERK